MRRLLKLSAGKYTLLLFVVLLIGVVISWSQYGDPDAFPGLKQMADVAHDELGLRPQFVGHLNLTMWRERTKKYVSWGDKLLPVLHQQVGLAIPYLPSCSVRLIASKARSLVVMGFSGMRTLYVSIVGDFQAKDYLKCAGKKMKQRTIGKQNVWIGDETFWWEGQRGALVGMGVNPRPPLYPFGLKHRLNLFGKQGVLHYIIERKGALFRGLRQTESPFAGMFSLSELEDMRLPKGITVQFHRMEGQIQLDKTLKLQIIVSMRKEKHAMRLMGLYHLTTSLAPPFLRTFLQPLKALRKGCFVQMNYEQPFAAFVTQARAFLWNEGKLPKKITH